MKLFIDENLDRRLVSSLSGHTVKHGTDKEYRGLKNGQLLDLLDAEKFEVLVTADKNLAYQQNFLGRGLALIVIDVHPRTWDNLLTCAQQLPDAIASAKPGEVRTVVGPHAPRHGRRAPRRS